MSGAKIIYTNKEKVNIWNKLGYYDVSVIGCIYMKKRKFLWWKLKPSLYTKIYVPYITDVLFDGESASNTKLHQAEVQMKVLLELEMDKIQRKINGIQKV